MQLRVFWATLRRRWYLALAALVITAGGTLFVVDRVGPTFETQGSVLIFPPVTTVERETQLQAVGNPYLVLGGVSQARDIVIRSLTSKSTQQELAEQTPGSSFEATPDYMNSAPIILVTVSAGNSEVATRALTAVMDRVPFELNQLQAGLNLPSDAVITSRPLIADKQPDIVRKGQIRTGITAGVGIAALCLLSIGLLDGLLLRRRRLNRESSGADTQAHSLGPTEPQVNGRGETSRRLGPRPAVVPGTRRTATDEAAPQSQAQAAGRRLHSVHGSKSAVESPKAAKG